jgi:hypothetical protein
MECVKPDPLILRRDRETGRQGHGDYRLIPKCVDTNPPPLTLSLSKGCLFLALRVKEEGKQPFDKLRDTDVTDGLM